MTINLTQIHRQVSQLREQANMLRETKSALAVYQHNLNANWRGQEMVPTNQVIDNHIMRIVSIASQLELIGSDILREADAVHREELMRS